MVYDNCPKVTSKASQSHFKSTVNCISSLFDQQILSIVGNQRPYEWKQSEMEKLLSDICNAWDKGEKVYFLSSILLKKTGAEINDRHNVVDGQQRLTSMCIMIAAIRILIKETKIKDNITAFLRGKDDETKQEHILVALHDKLSDFFAKYIMCDTPFSEEITSKLFSDIDICDLVDELAQTKVVSSISSKNMALNLILTLRFLKENILKEEQLLNLLSFIKYSCSFVVTIVQDTNELKIFNTLNRRGRPLSDMDTLKTEFIDKFIGTEEEKDQSVEEWNALHQELGEYEFSLMIESIRAVLEENPKEPLEAEQMIQKVCDNRFTTNFLGPVYRALKCLRNNTASSLLRKEIAKFNLLVSKHFMKESSGEYDPSEPCTVMMVLLVALYESIENSTCMFGHSEVWETQSSFILDLIKMWNAYLLKLCICSTFKSVKDVILPELELILGVVKAILLDDKEKIKKPLYSSLKQPSRTLKTPLSKRISGQDPNLLPFFEIYLKIIKIEQDFEKDPNASFSDLSMLVSKPIYQISAIEGSKTKEKNKLKQIGNFALYPSNAAAKLEEGERKEHFKKWNTGKLAIPDDEDDVDFDELDKRTNKFSQFITNMAEPTERKTSLGGSSSEKTTPVKPTVSTPDKTPTSQSKKDKKEKKEKKDKKDKKKDEEKKRKRDETATQSKKKK